MDLPAYVTDLIDNPMNEVGMNLAEQFVDLNITMPDRKPFVCKAARSPSNISSSVNRIARVAKIALAA